MENKKNVTATQQPLTQQHLMAHHVHPDQIYSPQHSQIPTHLNNQSQIQPNGVMHQLLQSQYHSNMNARSPLLENRHEMYGTGHNHEYTRHYGANDNFNYPQSPPRFERTEIHIDQNVNHELMQNIPKGYNAEVYQDYLKRNPPKDNNQIYQNHQPTYRPNVNQYGNKPYLPYSNRIGPQSNTELLRRQYNEIQQMKMQQQMHYQNQAQMHQQQKFAERQLLLQQIHGVQPPPNLQNSIYSDSSYRDMYSSKSDFKEYSSPDLQKDINIYAKNNEYRESDVQNRPYQDQWQVSPDYREADRQKQELEKSKSPDFNNHKVNQGIGSPMKSSESSTPSVKSPSSESRRSSGTQALRSPTAQRIPSAPVTLAGLLYKQGSDGLKVWRKRWFVLSEYCLFYYKSQDEEKLLGSVLLPSYKVSACSTEDKVMRKYAFKLEHANMRTYVLAALDQDAMMKWVKALTMAALMQNPNDQQKRNDRTAAAEEDDSGPTYANAPPKPRRANDGYNSPSPDMYDPNYDLLKKPASQYSQGTRYQDTYKENYARSPQSPIYQTKRYDTQNLTLPLNNENIEKSANQHTSNPQSPYFNNRSRNEQPDDKIESLYDKQPNYNPFQEYSEKPNEKPTTPANKIYNESYPETRTNTNAKTYDNNKPKTSTNERLTERRTPEAYGRSTAMSGHITDKIGDYEDIYTAYNDKYIKSPSTSHSKDTVSLSSHKSPQDPTPTSYPQEKVFSGPSVLRRKKMQANGVQPPMPRPHSADFLEYESKTELNKIPPTQTYDTKQPKRPKSSLDINSYYDPSSDKYYSEESYAQKMRQSAQYLQQQGLGPRNIQIPLEKYASGLAEKQLHSPYSQTINNNYETEFNVNRNVRDNISYNSKYSDVEGMSSNWTLKEKEEIQKEMLNRSGSVMSDSSNVSAFVKEKYDTNDGFIRSASARLPGNEREGEKKVQQREESMKRLLEWKQRMLQSPLTRKSTPATISLARSLNQSRQSLRSDQYKPKTYKNASYNSYSSDDEEETPSTDLQSTRMQAGRSYNVNVSSPLTKLTPHALSSNSDIDQALLESSIISPSENAYENILCTISLPKIIQDDLDDDTDHGKNEDTQPLPSTSNIIEHHLCLANESILSDHEGYETHDSEAESETQIEYTDNDLDEVLLASDIEVENSTETGDDHFKISKEENSQQEEEKYSEIQSVVVTNGEDHYLPMSPRKISTIEPAHKTLLEIINVFDQSMPLHYEDNPYVEMTLGNEEEDQQTYEVVCVNDEKPEPVYMELSTVISQKNYNEELIKSSNLLDTASNFADTKDQTLKRSSRTEKEKLQSSHFEEENKNISLDVPFSRFSISDTFRPASYYLSGSSTILERQDSSDNETLPPPPPVPSTSPPFDNLLDEELSKYILDKLDKSDIAQDNSIIKMLTSENQKMNKMKKRTTSLMIYGSRTSIHDTLSRGEKVRNSRASLTNERNKLNDSPSMFLNASITDQHNSSCVDSDSLRSYNADKGSSRLSLESDISSKFETAPSNVSEISSLLDSDSLIDLRHPYDAKNIENLIKRRPLSSDSIFEVNESENLHVSEDSNNIALDSYLYRLDAIPSVEHVKTEFINCSTRSIHKETKKEGRIISNHARSSSTPVFQNAAGTSDEERSNIRFRSKQNNDNGFEHLGSQSSCSSVGLPTSPISFYRKDYSGDTIIRKNLNKDVLDDKIKEFDSEKLALKHGNETAGSSTTTGFHSRESSTEHSAPYYYSDLSSQEHINVLPISHYLKNTNIHRKLNNQRRRGPINKKNEISHIHNPIRSNQLLMSEEPFDLAASARSVSVEFLSVVEKNPDIDLKNIYESTSSKTCKIPESMNLISSLSCKKSTKNKNYDQMSSPDISMLNENSVQTDTSIKVSSGSMSSYCSENSSNTVYYDAEAEASAYENVIYHGEKHWDEDVLWRDNLRRVSHRHARSMDDLDTMPIESSILDRTYPHSSTINSIKRIKKPTAGKINNRATYVNCDIKNHIKMRREDTSRENNYLIVEKNENDVYVSLAQDSEIAFPQSDEGVYEQLAIASSETSLAAPELHKDKCRNSSKSRRQFEIDRENLRQWDLMSSGLMKGESGRVPSAVVSVGMNEPISSKDNETDRSNQTSMTMSGINMEAGKINNNNNHIQQTLSKKAFLGSNTSIGRSNRDGNIPVRAVSPRVRWVEEKPSNDHYGSQRITASQQNLNTIMGSEEVWTTIRSPSRTPQPIRAVSPRVRRNTENDDMQKDIQNPEFGEVPTAGELLGRSHEELVLLLIQLRRRHAATHRAIETCCAQINSIEDCLSSLKAMEREESLQRLEQLKMQLMELESQYEKSKPLVQLVDNMVKLGSLYNRPGSTIERLERNQRLRHKVLAEHAIEQQRWIESAAAGKQLETEAARVRVAELWALEQELADEAAILQGLKTDKDAIDSLLTGVRSKLDNVNISSRPQQSNKGLEVELARVHAMLAHNSKKLEQTVADNARLERELHHLRRALRAQRANTHTHAQAHAPHPTAMLEDEVSRVQHLVSALQRQRQELSRAVRHLTQQSHVLQTTHDSMPGKRRSMTYWQETNLDTGHTIDHGHSEHYDVDALHPPGHYGQSMETPLYVDTRSMDVTPINSEDMQNSSFANLSNVEKQEIKTVRIVKRESERRQRDRERSLQPMSDWSSNITANLDQFLEEELVQPINNYRASSLPRTDKYEDYYTKDYHRQDKMDSPKYPSSPSLSYDFSQNLSSLSSSYNKNIYTKNDKSLSTQYLNSPTDSSRTLTNMSKTSSIMSLTRSNMELSPIFKSEAAKQIVTEMNDNGSMHRRQVPREKRRHNTAPHHLSAKTLNEMPKDGFNQDALGRSLDDADMELALRGAAPDVVRSALPSRKIPDSIDQLLAAPQKIIIPERYIPEKPPELSPEEQQKRLEKVESIKKMLTSSSADPSKSPDCEEKKQREHLLQMNQILAKQVTEMSKIIAVKALEELPLHDNEDEYEDRSPDVELPIYQQRDNFFT